MKKVSFVKNVYHFFDYLKKFGFSEKLIRRNPIYYSNAKALFISLKNKGVIERKIAIDELLHNSFHVKTPHLKNFDTSSGNLKVLPLIDKQKVQEINKNFLGTWSCFSIPSGTGGSTGVPLRLYRSYPSIVVEQAAIDSVYQNNGVEPLEAKIAVLRGDTIKDTNDLEAPFWQYSANNRILNLSSHHLNTETINHYLDELITFGADVIYAYPSSIEFFAYLMKETGRQVNIPLVVTSSEVFTSQSRLKVSNILNCKICDYYGQAERIAFAYSYKADEYYFLPGYSYIELKYKYNDDIHDYYEIIGTSLWNNAMSLQRYCTGDLAILPKGLTLLEIDEICYGVKPFFGILGRTSEYLLSPEGKKLIGINQIPKFINNVVQMQFIQNTVDQVDILVLPERGFNHEDKADILKNSRTKIPNSIELNVIITDVLQKTKVQKTPLVIRKI